MSPVSHTVAIVDTAAAMDGGHSTAAALKKAAPHAPISTPMSGNQHIERMSSAGWWSTHAGHGSRVRNIRPESNGGFAGLNHF